VGSLSLRAQADALSNSIREYRADARLPAYEFEGYGLQPLHKNPKKLLAVTSKGIIFLN
jgi:hypothetical protein